jgi:hypothetical protein
MLGKDMSSAGSMNRPARAIPRRIPIETMPMMRRASLRSRPLICFIAWSPQTFPGAALEPGAGAEKFAAEGVAHCAHLRIIST